MPQTVFPRKRSLPPGFPLSGYSLRPPANALMRRPSAAPWLSPVPHASRRLHSIYVTVRSHSPSLCNWAAAAPVLFPGGQSGYSPAYPHHHATRNRCAVSSPLPSSVPWTQNLSAPALSHTQTVPLHEENNNQSNPPDTVQAARQISFHSPLHSLS